MDTSYMRITELPVDMPEYQAFVTGLHLPDHKQLELLALIEAVNIQSAVKAVAYCTTMLHNKQVSDATEAWYDSIMDDISFRRRHQEEDAYATLYLRLRKHTIEAYKAIAKRLRSFTRAAKERVYP